MDYSYGAVLVLLLQYRIVVPPLIIGRLNIKVFAMWVGIVRWPLLSHCSHRSTMWGSENGLIIAAVSSERVLSTQCRVMVVNTVSWMVRSEAFKAVVVQICANEKAGMRQAFSRLLKQPLDPFRQDIICGQTHQSLKKNRMAGSGTHCFRI